MATLQQWSLDHLWKTFISNLEWCFTECMHLWKRYRFTACKVRFIERGEIALTVEHQRAKIRKKWHSIFTRHL